MAKGTAEQSESGEGPVREVPGSYGLPLIGLIRDVLEFRRGWEKFYARRRERYRSSVFRTHMGIKAISVTDHQGIQPLFDVSLVEKKFGFGPVVPPRRLVGNITPTVWSNDEEHERHKRFLLALLRQDAPRMLPVLETTVASYLDRWQRLGSFDWDKECQDLLADFLFEWSFGAQPGGDVLRAWTDNMFTRIPLPIPGSAFAKARRAYDRLVAAIAGSPRFPAIRELAAAEGLGAGKTAKILTFATGFNAWAGLQSFVRSCLAEFALQSDHRERARAEVRSLLGDAEGPLDLELLASLKRLNNLLLEVLRMRPPVSFLYNRARGDMVIPSDTGRYQVRGGEMVLGVVPFVHRDPAAFPDPDTFDPDRFGDPQAVANLVWPSGSYAEPPTVEDKKCAGADIVVPIAKVLFARLLQRYQWTLAETPRWSRGTYIGGNVPENTLKTATFRALAA